MIRRPRFRLTSPTEAQIRAATHPKEIQVHCAYVAWTERLKRQIPALARGFHPANGELRDARTGAKLKRMGVRSGVLDWCLPVARGGFGGMFIEFKRPDGKAADKKLTPEQSAEVPLLLAEGYHVEVHDDWERAAQATLDYVAGKIVRAMEPTA
jgi:hypothetical protein